MRSLNPFSGEFYREALQVSRYTREMFCLMEGRHVHPSTLYPGGVGTTATIQLFTDYYTRLMRYVEFMKRVVPMHDDLFDFFYEAMPGYEEVGRRRVLLGCWGAFQDPAVCNFDYRDMTAVGPGDGRHARRRRRRQAGHQRPRRDQPRHPHPARQLVLRRLGRPGDVRDAATRSGNPVDRRHPWNQHTIPQPQKRDFDDKYSWVMSPRWFDGTDHLALDTGGGPLARLWSTALSGLVNTDHIKATGNSVEIHLPKTALKPEVTFEWKIPQWSNTIERDRARTYFQAYAAASALDFIEKALADVRAGQDQDVGAVRGARRGHRLRVHRGGARRAVAPHGDQGRQDRQLPPVPADAVEREPARQSTARPARTRTRS